jgi:hypothetical protein
VELALEDRLTRDNPLGSIIAKSEGPFRADCVEKLENCGAPKIPQMSRIGDFSHCKALQNRYERLQSFLR